MIIAGSGSEVQDGPYCGDGECNNNEDSSDCCQDCSCSLDDYSCANNQCIKDLCTQNSDCDDSDPCTSDICTSSAPKECTYKTKESCLTKTDTIEENEEEPRELEESKTKEEETLSEEKTSFFGKIIAWLKSLTSS